MQRSLELLGSGRVTIGGVQASRWSLVLRDLRVDNPPGSWKAPYAVHIGRLHVRVSNLMALLSLHPGGLLRLGSLELTLGFRIKALESVEIEGVTVHLEDAPGSPAACGSLSSRDLATSSRRLLKRGMVRKEPMNGRIGMHRLREFVLEQSLLSWYEPGEFVEDARRSRPPQPKGTLRLFATSFVEASSGRGGEACGEGEAVLSVISAADTLTLCFGAGRERDSWRDAIEDAVAALGNGSVVPRHSNAAWLEALVAEDESRKVRWRRHAMRRRREWRRRWQQPPRQAEAQKEEAAAAAVQQQQEEEEAKQAVEQEEEQVPSAASSSSSAAHAPAGEGWDPTRWVSEGVSQGARWVEQRVIGAMEVLGEAFEDVLEWQIGRVQLRGLDITHNGHPYALAADGWELRGFVGSWSELERHLLWYGTEKDLARDVLLGHAPQVGLAAKLLKDSGERELKAKVSGFTGKDEYVFGDVTKAAVSKLGETVAIGVSSYTGKEEYVFGDLSRTTVHRLGEGATKLGETVAKPLSKLGDEVASGVSSFTGKKSYQFGDLSKAALARLANRILPKIEDDHAGTKSS